MKTGIVDPALTRELRRSVLRPDVPIGATLPGDDLPHALHFGATTADGAVVSTCFVYPEPCPWLPERVASWHLRQMATDPAHRGRRYAGDVVEAAVAHLRTLDAGLLWCNAREQAVPFYARHGFLGEGAIFTDERHTIPHLRMWLELTGAPVSS
ncbi:MAG: GNAT family N-acetyltransferase [Jatrophihabitantaceae bacterium]